MQNWVNQIGHNMLSYSEQFDNALWQTPNTTVTANSATAPNGETTADRLVSTSLDASTYNWFSGVKDNTTYTASVYLKNNGGTSLKLYIWDRDGGNFTQREVISEINSSTWTRVEISVTTGTGANRLYFYVGFNQNADSDVFAWGAQINRGSSATDYLKTEASASEGSAYATTWYDQSGVEVVSSAFNDNHDFTSGWTTYGTATIDDSDSYTTTGGGGIAKSIGSISGDWVRIKASGTTTASDIQVYAYLSNTLLHSISLTDGAFDFDVIVQTDDEQLYLRNGAAGTTNYDTFTVEIVDKAHNDATQTTADNQPKVVDAGVLVTDANGNYALDGGDASAGRYFDLPPLSLTNGTIGTSVEGETGIYGNQGFLGGNLDQYLGILEDGGGSAEIYRNVSVTEEYVDGVAQTWGTRNLAHDALITDSFVLATFEGVTTTQDFDGLMIGDPGGGFWFVGKFSAIIIYPTDQSANRSAIEQSLSNIITTALS
jgi:hypothetical protein